jgi:reverse gyrase
VLSPAQIAVIATKLGSLDEKRSPIPMSDSTSTHLTAASPVSSLATANTLELAQALAERLAITPDDWHRLKSNRQARAGEQAAVALVYLLKDQPQEALARLQQAAGWLDRSISAPPCPTHGDRQASKTEG